MGVPTAVAEAVAEAVAAVAAVAAFDVRASGASENRRTSWLTFCRCRCPNATRGAVTEGEVGAWL